MAVRTRLISSGSSRNHAQDVRTSDGLTAFAAGQAVALWSSSNDKSVGVHQTLPGHQGDVTALKFAHDGIGSARKESSVFVSGDSKGTARVWKEKGGEWSTLAVLPGHSGSVASVEALELEQEGELLVLTGGSDAVIQVWKVSAAGTTELTQKVDLKDKIPLQIALVYLPSSSSLVLAIGGTETRIQLYTSPSATQPNFRRSLTLEGHSDWVRALSFITPVSSSTPPAAESSSPTPDYDISPGEVLLASGSQDNYIRLWRFSRVESSPSTSATPSSSEPATSGLDALDALDEALAAADEEELRVKAHDFTVASAEEGGKGETFSCASEAVLLGHDAWVTGLNWAPLLPSSSQRPLRLLSTSADRSLILWEPIPSGTVLDPSSSSSTPSYRKTSAAQSAFVWTSTRRFGEFTSSTNLGFFGALWGLEGRTVMASGWGGSWHVWRFEGEWEPQVAITGHLGPVKQVVWEPEGEYLLSCGAKDMSTRLWAPWRREGVETWHELARPQIHGYPLASLSFTPNSNRLQFVSGADEKIVRVFDAPCVFLSSLKKLSGVDAGDKTSRPIAANVPPLGLSNRAIANTEEAAQIAPASSDPFEAVNHVDFTVNSHPPLEEQLLGSTLWPETEKLYGHSFELVAVSSAHSAPLIATACKATLPEHAVIRLYNTSTWRPVGDVLVGHSLTITKLAFSPAGEVQGTRDRWLLSVGRDRTWRVYERDDTKGEAFPGGPFWMAWGINCAATDAERATASGLIPGFGQLGAIIATWTYLPTDAPNYRTGNSMELGFTSLNFLLAGVMLWYVKRENKIRRAGGRDYRLAKEGGKGGDKGESEENEVQRLGINHPAWTFSE
ncbi:hypothetical protein JCM8547_005709 [Rhodosporidiobolus lusitaniae]